jgi:hypothetical protein
LQYPAEPAKFQEEDSVSGSAIFSSATRKGNGIKLAGTLALYRK